MANVKLNLPKEYMSQLTRLGKRTDEIISKMLVAGGEVVLPEVRSNLQAVIGRDTKYPSRSTGELVDALGLTPPDVDKKGVHNIKVGFREPRRGGGINAKVANIIEHGKPGQPAKPFLEPARRKTASKVTQVMAEVFDREVMR